SSDVCSSDLLGGRRIGVKAWADKSKAGNGKKQRKAAKSLGRHRLSRIWHAEACPTLMHPTVVTVPTRGFYHILRQPRRKVTTGPKNVSRGERFSDRKTLDDVYNGSKLGRLG